MFSVLMSVYDREQPAALSLALDSLAKQTRHPAEVLVVKDGPLSSELNIVIECFKTRLPLRVHSLTAHGGLASALNEGLKVISQPWVMRFDSDDVCLPNRVEIQTSLALSGEAQLFGSQIEEFEDDPSRPVRTRVVPCAHEDIMHYGLRRNPFNHMTVCYPRELVLSVGGYPHIPFMEDYALWMRMLARGVRAMNSPAALVRVRTGNSMIARRGGGMYVQSELKMQRHLVALGLKSRSAAVFDGAVRSTAFLSPLVVRRWLYSNLLRR